MKKILYNSILFIVIISIIVNFSSVALSAEERLNTQIPDQNLINDIIAGVINPEELNLDLDYMYTKSNRASNKSINMMSLINDDIYYINNEETGKYIRYTSALIAGASGLISSLGNTVRWKITTVENGYTISSTVDTTKFLSVPTNTSSSSVTVTSVTSATIPENCIWDIRVAIGGGCLIQSNYNSKYLYCEGTSIYTSSNVGTSSTEEYSKKVWRIASIDYYGNTSSSTKRELSSNTTFSSISTNVGGIKSPNINHYYANELWANPSDFTYSGYSNNITSARPLSGDFVGKASGSTYVTATHKVTNISKSFYLSVSVARLFESPNRPGVDRYGDEARDMHVSDKTRGQLLSMNFTLLDLANIYDLPPASSTVLPPQGPDVLKDYMRELPALFSSGNSSMRNVATSMVEHFLSGSGDDFSNNTLTQTVYAHSATTRFVNNTKQAIINAMENSSGNMASLADTSSFVSTMDNISLPAYNTTSDYTNGLKICLNGIWGYNIDITAYDISDNRYSATIRYTLFDHFGLDDGDVTDSGWYSEFLGHTNQFGSWYVLQRYENCNSLYKPFVTYVIFEEVISGTFQ